MLLAKIGSILISENLINILINAKNKKQLPAILLNGKNTKKNSLLEKNWFHHMTKIKIRKYFCLNNLGSILLNDINTKRKNMFAYHSIKWQKHLKIKTHKTRTYCCLKNLGFLLLNKKNTKRKEILV